VPVKGDTLDEPDETFTVALSGATNATIADATGTGTINDDDASSVTVAVSDVSLTEGDAGTNNATFTVSLNQAATSTVTVDAATANGSATAPADYTALPATTLTFLPGQTSKTIDVAVKGDTLDEPDETFTVVLSAPSNATIADPSGTGTISDDDPPPALSISDVSVTEGNAGTTNATFIVSLSQASAKTVTVDAATANASATAPADYTALPATTLTFSSGEISKLVPVPVKGDTLDEPDETFTVALSAPSNATISDGSGTGTITDDDPPPALSITDVSVTEGNAGTTNATFTVTLNQASAKTVSVDATSATGSATAPADYTSLLTSTLTFSPGETSKTVSVPVKGDTLDEPDETFTVNLSAATNATITDASGTGTISDDDPPPALSISDQTVTEGNSGTTAMTFTVTLAAASGRTVSVGYATQDGSATQLGDYSAAGGTITFGPGETAKTLTVAVVADTAVEGDETFGVVLSGPVNATIADAAGSGTVVNDDSAAPPPVTVPVVGVGDATVSPEGHSGTKPATFAVTLSQATTVPVTVSYATANGTAAQPADYVAAGGSVTFAPGETAKSVVIQVKGDLLKEPDETFRLQLSNPSGATLGRAQGTGTIDDDDVAPPFITAPDSVDRGDMFCGLQHRGKCPGLTFSGTFPGKGKAVWTFTAYDPKPGKRPKQLELDSFDAKVKKAGKMTMTLRLTGKSADKLLKKVKKAGYRRIRISLEFTTSDGRRYTAQRTLKLDS
jgi:chitinase